MVVMYVVLGVLALVVLYVMGTYNGLVRLRQHVRESWSGIDTELKRRYNLIPNLVETVKGYASHEKETLDRVISARAKAVSSTGSPESQARDENMLVGALRQLFAVVENYPNLKANENFIKLQGELTATEDRIQAARRFYNANVRDLNTRIEVFPSNVIANLFSFQKEEFFELEDAAQREVPKVDFKA
ncbi:LemA family protein [Candidatus Bipolaricaulota bacterium]|nr:LemA family protein [Candidatus Bipolaricaulota bacterium]